MRKIFGQQMILLYADNVTIGRELGPDHDFHHHFHGHCCDGHHKIGCYPFGFGNETDRTIFSSRALFFLPRYFYNQQIFFRQQLVSKVNHTLNN